MTQPPHGLAEKVDYMYYIIKSGVCVLFSCMALSHGNERITMGHISFDHCKKRGYELAQKIQRRCILNACLTSVATVYTAYSVLNFLLSDGSLIDKHSLTQTTKTVLQEESPTPTGLLWVGNMVYESSLSLMKMCARHICARWLVSYMMPDFSLKNFMKEYTSHQEYMTQLLAQLKQGQQDSKVFHNERTVVLIQAHVQKTIDNIGFVMIYLLAHADKSSIARKNTEDFVLLTIQSLERELAVFHNNYNDGPIVAYQNFISVVTDLLMSSIAYTRCAISD